MGRYLLAFFLVAPLATAQPFETLEIGVSGLGTVSDAPYTEYWDPGAGVAASVETPFYLGSVALGGAFSVQSARPDTRVPDYLAFYSYASWGTHIPLPGGLRLRPGLRAGLFAMRFDVDDVASVRSESELGAGLDLGLSVPLGRGWHATASGAALRIYTAERIELGFLQFGISRVFATPAVLKEFLQ